MHCSDCSRVEPIEDSGEIRIRQATPEWAEAAREAGITVEGQDSGSYSIPYATRDELLTCLERLRAYPANAGTDRPLQVGFRGHFAGRQSDHLQRWFGLEQLEARFRSADLIDIISRAEFCSYLQPIVDRDGAAFGYEFLLRPLPGGSPFQPYELFEAARRSGFHSFLDRAARISAIEAGTRQVPKGLKRFINFLPSSIYNPKYCLTHTFAAIERLDQDPRDFVFEVVESERITDITHLASIFAEYRRHGIGVALDDVGAGFSTIEVLQRLQPDFVKIDRGLVSFCDADYAKQAAIREIAAQAHAYGGTVLAEGIERREEFECCLGLGAELGQGYLFGRPVAEL
ncbi:EAL domain-containing protein [Paenibacillus spiritus]|uniref:EAL domain-containing protein n=1 Tax=Paenibacillus spiritus TaxID=2496557 RepID=A0A5J5G456_9BACL|nr:EAL domain-containing protein [Paenibacillus spiritus]KAA9000984.1 EAL domain-containing protein [Paenibacillus spiritus]